MTIQGGSLKTGATKSCGCLNRENRRKSKNKTHGMRHSRLYNIWANMKARCNNPLATSYPSYGSRGIKVCDEWGRSFQDFYNWAATHGYTDELTIDRIDNDKDYTPDNCRWVSLAEQQRNRRNNCIVEINGERKTVTEWCRETSIPLSTIRNRIKRGISYEVALQRPGPR